MNMYRTTRGFSLVEVIIVIAVISLFFGGLIMAFSASLRLIAESRSKMTAISLSTDRLEFIRSLPYDTVGTVSGIPNGPIPQNRTVSLNGINFNERVIIEFVDDPGDGLLGADQNSIISDYKRIKIELTWSLAGQTYEFDTVSTIVPRSIETTAGGGSLRVNVFDANVLPLENIDVRLVNNTTTTTIDTIRKTDATGVVIFTGAPAAANYQIFVTAPGYSSDQTYQATTSLPNPATLPVAILEADVSTMNFQVDRLSTLTYRVISSEVLGSSVEPFDDEVALTATSAIAVATGTLQLASSGSVYEASGHAWLAPISPSSITAWGVADILASTTAPTTVRVQFFATATDTDLISDAVLPGNSVGFTQSMVNLQTIPVASYATLVPRVVLTTSDTNVTPYVHEFRVSYVESETPRVGTTLDVVSARSIGTLGDGSPVPKHTLSSSTDANGRVTFTNIEWGEYSLVIPGSSFAEVCSQNPILVAPGGTTTVRVRAIPYSDHNLRVVVVDMTGQPVIGGEVILTRGSATTALTSWCGQAFFSSLAEDTNYRLEVRSPGFVTAVFDPFTVSGNTVQVVSLAP